MKDISGTLRHCGRDMSNFQLSDIHGATFKTKRKRDTSALVIGFLFSHFGNISDHPPCVHFPCFLDSKMAKKQHRINN